MAWVSFFVGQRLLYLVSAPVTLGWGVCEGAWCHLLWAFPCKATITKLFNNTPFPSSFGPQYQNEVKYSTFDMEMFLIFMQIKLISTRKVVHLASFWKWGFWNSEVAYSKPIPFELWVKPFGEILYTVLQVVLTFDIVVSMVRGSW